MFYNSGDMLWGSKGGFPDAAVNTVGETAVNCAHSGGLYGERARQIVVSDQIPFT